MTRRLLIANRGEIAMRVAHAAREMGVTPVTVYSQDDEGSPHRFASDEAVALAGAGAAAYLDGARIVDAARDRDCSLIHPGYGFLSENSDFAARCERAGITFVGAAPAVLELFGDKTKARNFARQNHVPVAPGTSEPTSLEEMHRFHASLPAGARVMLKAVAGGGGRGMRVVGSAQQLPDAFARCSSEAAKAFGDGALYIEQCIDGARHIEVQVAGDGTHSVQIGERECSVQLRHQKIVEIAPAPEFSAADREMLYDAALRMAQACRLRGLCTFEFLVSPSLPRGFVFIEANPRLQVEHTVTEEVFGVDLVRAQIALALGDSLAAAGLSAKEVGVPRGYAIQYRINMDSAAPQDDDACVTDFSVPTGKGIRMEACVSTGWVPSRNFDPLLAKLIVHSHSPDFAVAADKGSRALGDFVLEGIPSNIGLLRAIADDAAFRSVRMDTMYVENQLERLRASAPAVRPRRPGPDVRAPRDVRPAPIEDGDPSAVRAPTRGTVTALPVAIGARVRQGELLCVLDAMKMEHVVEAPCTGVVAELNVRVGDLVALGQALFSLDPVAESDAESVRQVEPQSRGLRKDLQEVAELHRLMSDEGRPEAVERRHAMGMRTARENLADLCDPGSLVEYGSMAVGAHHGITPLDELRRASPADGFIYGMARINGRLFGPDRSRCFVASYDYTVHAGTQGFFGHKKHDRMFQLAEAARKPVVIFTEGGGGRPTEPNNVGGANLATATFFSFASLSGLVPLVGIVAGRCFAGNAALLGCCDVVIATRNATIGMGGPVMIEGAGLGVYRAEEVGPAPMHAEQGVVDILVEDEAAAVSAAKKYLSYFQGALDSFDVPDQRKLRDVVPDRRTRAYDMRKAIAALCDTGSVLELRAGFAPGGITALVRIEGRPMGLIANNPVYNAGAVCAAEADKFARFVRLCDAHGLPIVSLCDTPGIMVGPEAERTAIVRRSCRMLIAGANITVPYFTVILRKAYGLGAMAMGGGSFHHGSFFTVAWPTAEFGGMGLEGQVRLGYRRELEAITDPGRRAARYGELVDGLYQHGKATNFAPFLTFDDVIDPADTRRWILAGLDTIQPRRERAGPRVQPGVDSW